MALPIIVATAEANIRQACLAGENDVCRKRKYTKRGGTASSITISGDMLNGAAGGMALNKVGQGAGSKLETQLYRTKRPL